MISGLQPFPLGDPISGSPHSVCVNLPTMEDVRGYEEKDPRVMGALRTGYPRFLEHPFIAALAARWKSEEVLDPGALLLCANGTAARDLIDFAGAGRLIRPAAEEIRGVWISAELPDAIERGYRFLQHTGGRISSREAEAALVRAGIIASAFVEERVEVNGEAVVRRSLAPSLGVGIDDFHLTRGGMNAFYAAFRAVNAVARPRGRRRWIQLGWLYVDTINILTKWSEPDQPPLVWGDVRDLDGLRKALGTQSDEIAGIVAEVPTNPLFGMPELSALRRLADEIGAYLVLDPSLVSCWNAPVLCYADVLVASETKYAVPAGDVMAGVLAINPCAPRAPDLRAAVKRWICPLSTLDFERWAAQVGEGEDLVRRVNETLPIVADFLETHPLVSEVWWARPSPVAPWLGGSGAVISFTVKGPVADFYDRLELAKGPSFGTAFSLLSPYVWLAHFDLIQSPAGRDALARAKVPVDLLRLSVGLEPADAIIATLERALSLNPRPSRG